MTLVDFWFYVIALLWVGYLFLEGFDFGVGMLLPVLARDDKERRVMINTIGPVWDGNEVWLLTAGGATFAAFPFWYATMFSGFFLPLLIILLALIVRNVAFEYRGKGRAGDIRWIRTWDRCLIFGSLVPAVMWGIAFANILRGVPLNANGDYTGGFFNLLSPYALLGGLTTCTVFLMHGAVFVALKTSGDIQVRAEGLAKKLGVVALLCAGSFLVWTQLAYGSAASAVLFAVAAVALVFALVMVTRSREGWAFVGLGITIATFTFGIFVALYPNVMPATDPQYSLTAEAAASSPYTLQVMTIVAVITAPVVIAYQAWTYWVFRKRISVKTIPDAPKAPKPKAQEVGPPDGQVETAR